MAIVDAIASPVVILSFVAKVPCAIEPNVSRCSDHHALGDAACLFEGANASQPVPRAISPLMPTRLVEPSVQWLEAFLRLVDEVQDERDFSNVAAVRRDGWKACFARVEGMRAGTIPTRSGVPMSTFWLLRGHDEVLGVSGLQHRLTPSLRQFGGHVGYAVRPSARGRGFGTTLLAETLARAREFGIDPVIVTCDADNIASRRVIEKCRGVLEAEERVPQWPVLVRRYVIANAG